MNRRVRLSTWSDTSRSTAPAIWLRKPCSFIDSLAVMPDVPAFSAARTSVALLPMLDTIPSPVTTTRRILRTPCFACALSLASPVGPASVFGQRHFHIFDLINHIAIRFDPAIGHAHCQASGLHGLREIHVIG